MIYYNPFHIGNDPGNRLGGNNSIAAVTAIPRCDGWTSVRIPLDGRRNARDWGYHSGDRLRILFNDSGRLSRADSPRYGLPLSVPSASNLSAPGNNRFPHSGKPREVTTDELRTTL